MLCCGENIIQLLVTHIMETEFVNVKETFYVYHVHMQSFPKIYTYMVNFYTYKPGLLLENIHKIKFWYAESSYTPVCTKI